MISVITCSIDSKKLAALRQSLAATTTLPYQLIVIENSYTNYSLCEAYNLGAEQSKFEHLCFVHEDITFQNKGWDQNLVAHFSENKISLIGILGNVIKTKYASGVYSSVQESNRIHQLQKMKDGSSLCYYNNPKDETYSEVATLDGMLLATKKQYWQNNPFDAKMLTGFHGYDMDYSLQMKALGKVVVVYNIIVEHASGGGNTIDWIESQVKIVKKWKSNLPIILSQDDQKLLQKRVRDDLTQLTINSLKLKYKLGFSYRYGLLTIIKFPFQRLNLFIIKHLLLQSLQWLRFST